MRRIGARALHDEQVEVAASRGVSRRLAASRGASRRLAASRGVSRRLAASRGRAVGSSSDTTARCVHMRRIVARLLASRRRRSHRTRARTRARTLWDGLELGLGLGLGGSGHSRWSSGSSSCRPYITLHYITLHYIARGRAVPQAAAVRRARDRRGAAQHGHAPHLRLLAQGIIHPTDTDQTYGTTRHHTAPHTRQTSPAELRWMDRSVDTPPPHTPPPHTHPHTHTPTHAPKGPILLHHFVCRMTSNRQLTEPTPNPIDGLVRKKWGSGQ